MATAGTWSTLNPPLSKDTLEVLSESFGFDQMTPVQAASIPLLLTHKDVAAEACTGSGKTLAFTVPIVEILMRAVRERKETITEREGVVETPMKIDALVVVPIRELAQQVSHVMEPFCRKLGIRLLLFTKGEGDPLAIPEPITPGLIRINSKTNLPEHPPTIVVGTPGRVRYSMSGVPQKSLPIITCKKVEILVLDEADRLLEMGFQNDINDIFSYLPKQRRTGLFSATQTDEVKDLMRAGLRNPVIVNVEVHDETSNEIQKIPTSLSNYWAICPIEQKLSQLVKFIVEHPEQKFIVYFLTCACVDFFWKIFTKLEEFNEIMIYSLHGKVTTENRQKTYTKFVEAEKGVLFTTDVAARGLDIPDVDWIIQFDPPQDPSMFVHRIGRTARMGRKGEALVFLEGHEDSYIELLQIRKVPITELKLNPVPSILGRVRELCKSDRDIMNRSNLAFVSYVRGYKEHQCKFIFRFSKIDMGALANAFGLLRLPKMPEIPKGKNYPNFQPLPLAEIEAIKFLIPEQEKARQRKLKEPKKKHLGPKKTVAWSKTKEAKEKRVKQREIKEARRSWKERQAEAKKLAASSFSSSSSSSSRSAEDDDMNDRDWQELAKESKLKKKLHKKKISKAEFEAQTNKMND